MTEADQVLWHDIECGGYFADLPVWRALADATGGPVLDVGCGTGRVALDLARHGHAVTGLDREPELLAALRERAGELAVETVQADARAFDLGRTFALCVVPMQTIQLMGGPGGRAEFLACARRHLAPGGLLAAAVADALESFDAEHTEPPLPDIREVEGVVYSSQPVAVRDDGPVVTIERIRQTVQLDGRRTAEDNAISLDRLSPTRLAGELRAAGFEPLPARRIAPTGDHVGSRVVIARA